MNVIWRVAIAGFLHVLLHVGLAVFLDPPVLPWATDAGTEFLTLFAVGVVHSVGIAVLVRASTLRGVGLMATVAALYVASYVVFPPVVSELVERALPDGAKTDYALLGMGQALLWVPVAVWLMSRWAGDAETPVMLRPKWPWLRPVLLVPLFVALRFVGERLLEARVPTVDPTWKVITEAPSVWVWWAIQGAVLAVLAWPWLRRARGLWLWRGLWLGAGLGAFAVVPGAVDDWPALALPAAVALAFGLAAGAGWFLVGHPPEEAATPEEPALSDVT